GGCLLFMIPLFVLVVALVSPLPTWAVLLGGLVLSAVAFRHHLLARADGIRALQAGRFVVGIVCERREVPDARGAWELVTYQYELRDGLRATEVRSWRSAGEAASR